VALYHVNAKVISRSGGRSSMSNAAYICGEKATDIRTGTTFDYRNKAGEVLYKNILLPQGMEHLNNTEILWNAVERFEDELAEKRYGNYKDAILQQKSLAAKERFLNSTSTSFCLEVSLPKEMNLEEHKELSDLIAKEIFGSRNLIVQYAIHDKKDNPHVHFASNFRPVKDGRFLESKYRFKRADIKEIRKQIADITNNYAVEQGYDFSIDHRSYIEQGIYIEPTKHVGWYGSKLLDNSRIILENREILSSNTAILLASSEEAVKFLIQNKTVFTLEELKLAAQVKFGGDAQTIEVIRELIAQKSADSLIEKAAYFGRFLEVAHRLRECALNSGEEQLPEDKLFIKALREERQLFATKIIENESDYKWLMSRVGITGETIEAMASEKLAWNDRSLFIGHNVPSNLKSGDTLASLAKSLGNKDLDQGLVSIFNLENLGSYVLGRDAYISQADLSAEKNITRSREKLFRSNFGGEASFVAQLFKKRPEQNIYSVIEYQEKKQGYKLSKEQKEAATYLVRPGAYGALIGKAGTGKTTTLRVVAASYQKAGFRVIGTSFQGAAVAELGASLGAYMDSGFTLSRLDKEWRSIDKGSSSNNKVNEYELSDKTVVIVDEAAMAPRYLLQSLFTRAIEKGTKIISVGDTGQISSIDRSDMSRLILDGGAVLSEVRRQNNPGDAKASNYFARGFIKSGLEIYENKGSVVISETEFSSKLSLIHNVASKLEPSNLFKHLIIAYKNSDVEDLNSGMQRILKEDRKLGDKITLLTGFDKMNDKVRGDILANSVISKALAATGNNIIQFKKDTLSYEDTHTLLAKLDRDGSEYEMLTNILKPKEFYVGDKIRFTSNFNKGIGGSKIYNGSLGIIESYDSKNNSIVVMCEDQEQRTVDLTCYQGLDLGYVVTINRSQGKGVENSYVYLANTRGAKIGSKEFYVAATRHRGKVIFYTSREYLQDKELYQKIGERWKVTARDLKDNPELELVFKLEEKSREAYLLWSDMQKDVRGGKCNLYEHEKFKDYRQLKSELAKLSVKAKDNWDRVRIYASESMISLDDIERWIGAEDQNTGYKENSKLREYRELRSKTAELWVSILGSRSSMTYENSRKFNPDAKLADQNAQELWNKKAENHILTPAARAELYAKFNKSTNLRNKLAYELASFGAKEQIYDRSGNLTITNIYNHTDKSEWSSILRHSNMYIKSMTAKGERIENVTREIDTKSTLQEQHIMLKAAVSYNADSIARKILGKPNNKLSSKHELRFGENGNISVRISGAKSGRWYDFSASVGGDMFDLVINRSGCDFKEAADYLRMQVGMSNRMLSSEFKKYDASFAQNDSNTESKALTDHQKQAKVDKLYARSQKLEQGSIALRYLREHRSIDCSAGNDVREANVYISGRNYYLPALVAFVRNNNGDITGYQQILLDKNTGAKADIPAPKRSFGKISGSFVEVSKGVNSDITIIAEGLETALSVKEALSEHGDEKKGIRPIRILCSLGINNIKNYDPKKGEKIIIAADNDGPDSITGKTVLNAKVLLEEKGAFVEVVKPDRNGDFNDLLKAGESKLINSLFAPVIASHSAKTLEEYVKAQAEIKPVTLDKNDKANLAYIAKYDLPQEAIIDSYRKGELQGKLKLEHIRKGLEQASNHFNNNKEILEEARSWGYKASKEDITKSLIGMDEEYSKEHCASIRNGALNKYFTDNLTQFEEQKKSKFKLESLKPIMVAEQGFLKETYASLKSPIKEQGHENQEYLEAGKIALTKPEILEETFGFAKQLVVSGIKTEESLLNDLKNTTDLKASHEKMGKELETHFAKEAIRDVQRDSLKYLLELRAARKLSTPPEQQNENCDKTPNSIRSRVEEDSKMFMGDYKVTNQHLIDKTLRNFDGTLADYVVLKKTIADLQRFGKAEELRDGLILFKDKGIKAFSCYTSTISSNNIRDSINKDFSNILKGKDLELVDGSKCSNKSEYLIALSKDEQIMRYIEPRSDIGKEIQNQQSIQNEKTKDYDFER
jgi:flagellar biosynthesis GTPase FlhF